MSSLDWNPDVGSRIKNVPYAIEDKFFDAPVGIKTLFRFISAP